MIGYGDSPAGMPSGGAWAPRRPRTRRTGILGYAPLVAALALRIGPEPAANLSYLVLAGYALMGRPQAIRALGFSWLFTMMNPGLAPDAALGSVGRFAVIFGSVGSMILHRGIWPKQLGGRPFFRFTLALGVFILCHSLVFSPVVDVSVLKALSWTMTMATIIAAWGGLSDQQRDRLTDELFWFLILVLIASLPLAVMPLGYLVNGTGFQGILNQPQVFGSVMGLLGAWAAARMFGNSKPAWWLIGLVGACLGLVLMSEARTAGLAMVGGFVLSILLAPGFGGQSIACMVPGLRSGRTWTALCVVLIASLVMAPKIAGMAEHFITKSGRASGTSMSELYNGSRGITIRPMLDNISKHPLTGIGFGIASDPATMDVVRDPLLGLPAGAAVEKGVTPLMVLEELGIFGVPFVALWILMLLQGCARSGLEPFAVCLTALLLNMGEATLFSPGGMGLLLLVLLGWAHASGFSTYPPTMSGARRSA